MLKPRWLTRAMVEASHYDQIQTTGGLHGIRDENVLESTLQKPQNLLFYGDSPDIFDLAASYSCGLGRNHCFIDGNKRAALAALLMFLGLNGYRLNCDRESLFKTILDVATGQIEQDTMAQWIRENSELWEK